MAELSDEEVRSLIVECIVKKRYRLTDEEKRSGKALDVVRDLAKRPSVRAAYAVAKSSGMPFFEVRSALDLNPLQVRLLHWLEFYSSMDGAYEKPPDRVIRNDAMLDSWLESKAKEAEERSEKDWQRGSSGMSRSASDHDDVCDLV